MDGYLALLEHRMDKIEARLGLHEAVLVEPLAAKAKADADAAVKAVLDKKAADDRANAEMADRMKKREADRKAATEQAKAQAEKELMDEHKATTAAELKTRMKAELQAQIREENDFEAKKALEARQREAAAADFKARFGDAPTVPNPTTEKTTVFPTRPGDKVPEPRVR